MRVTGRSKLTWLKYLTSVLAGSLIGIALSEAGGWRAELEGETVDFGFSGLMRFGLPALAGAVAGAVLVLTSEFRSRGRWAHYLSWSLAGILAAVCVIIPDTIPMGNAWPLLSAIPMGIALGMGLGLFARQLGGHSW